MGPAAWSPRQALCQICLSWCTQFASCVLAAHTQCTTSANLQDLAGEGGKKAQLLWLDTILPEPGAIEAAGAWGYTCLALNMVDVLEAHGGLAALRWASR